MPTLTVSHQESLANILSQKSNTLPNRFKAMFCLRTLNTDFACEELCKVLNISSKNTSELLEHELAYILGQMMGVRDEHFLDSQKISEIKSRKSWNLVRENLESTLLDTNRNSIVRHEAGEALGAMLSVESLEILQRLSNPDNEKFPEVVDTCQLSVGRITFYQNLVEKAGQGVKNSSLPILNAFSSVDPAPPKNLLDHSGAKISTENLIKNAAIGLLDQNKNIFQRYQCMFELRNEICSGNLKNHHNLIKTAVDSINQALHCTSSALLRHEIGYVIGQILSLGEEELGKNNIENICDSLEKSVRNNDEHGMVRHESAMAFGEIDNEKSRSLMKEFSNENVKSDILRDSCVVALNMVEDTDEWLGQQFEVC